MHVRYLPDEDKIIKSRQVDDPMLILISHDSDFVIIGNIDVYGEHLILLKHAGLQEREIDNFFRVIANNEGADWTFVCPSNYKNIIDRDKRIEFFYNDGIDKITKVLKELNFGTEINIPKRYRRHLEIFTDMK